jgi:hypothetical protein
MLAGSGNPISEVQLKNRSCESMISENVFAAPE